MNLFNEDPAFGYEVNALLPLRKQGDFTDDKTKAVTHYDVIVLQCTWQDVSGRTSICLARPVADYKPDLAKISGPVRLAVTSAQSKGGILTLRFSGWEPITPKK